MRAALYSPYLDTLGGGERYIASFAFILASSGWMVELESADPEIAKKLEARFGIDLKDIRVVASVKRGDGYDLCFWLSDGSIPTLFARRNILHFQRPFYNVDGGSLVNKFKLFRISDIVVNSLFTKKWVDEEYQVDSRVIYPPVDTLRLRPKRKENLILFVGRFSQLEQAKRQDVLITAFKKFFARLKKTFLKDGWRLVLAGGSEVGRTEYVDTLISEVRGFPVEIKEGPTLSELKDLYGHAKIFWSAAGFGVNAKTEPNKLEHFGITAVEAMAAGAVPMLYKAGGHLEIVKEDGGFLWSSVDELVKSTLTLIKDPKILRQFSEAARASAQRFSLERFKNEVRQLI